MKEQELGLCSVTFREKSCDEILEIAKALNLHAIEWGGDVHVIPGDYETARKVGDKTKALGMACSYGSYYRATEKEEFYTISKTAKALGASIIRIWAGIQTPPNIESQEYTKLVERIRDAGLIALDAGQTVCFEYHDCTYAYSAHHDIQLLQDVGLPNVKTYWQTMYWGAEQLTEEERIERNKKALIALTPYIVNMHINNVLVSGRKFLDEDAAEWASYISLLPNGYKYLEFTRDDAVESLKRDLAFLRTLL